MCYDDLLVCRTRRGAAVISAGLFLLTCLFARQASASIYTLSPGANIPAMGSGFPAGGTVEDTVVDPFDQSVVVDVAGTMETITLEGTLTSQAILGDLSNPYHGYTFTYLLSVTNTANDTASALSVGSYAGFTTDVSYNTNSGGVLPSNFSRSGGIGNTLQFSFLNGGGINPGQQGALIVVQTGASSYTAASGAVIDNQSINLATLAPAVPEPGVAGLAVTGLGAFLAFRRLNSK